jgi:hypothetical protein
MCAAIDTIAPQDCQIGFSAAIGVVGSGPRGIVDLCYCVTNRHGLLFIGNLLFLDAPYILCLLLSRGSSDL